MNSQFPKQYGRIRREALIKSLLSGAVIGFALQLVTALLLWIFDVDGWWLSLIAFAAVTLIFAVIFYFKKL